MTSLIIKIYTGQRQHAHLLADGKVHITAGIGGRIASGAIYEQHAAAENPFLPEAALADGPSQGLREPEHLRSHSRHPTRPGLKLVSETLNTEKTKNRIRKRLLNDLTNYLSS